MPFYTLSVRVFHLMPALTTDRTLVENLSLPVNITSVERNSRFVEVVFDVAHASQGAECEKLILAVSESHAADKLCEFSFDGNNFSKQINCECSISKYYTKFIFHFPAGFTTGIKELGNLVKHSPSFSQQDKDFIICTLRAKQESDSDRINRLIEKIQDME